MNKRVFRLTTSCASPLLLCLSLAASRPAFAVTYQVFDISGTLQSGAEISGTVTLEVGDGEPFFSSFNITSTDAPGVALTKGLYQGGSAEGTWVELAVGNPSSTASLTIYLQTSAGNLVDYQGGPITRMLAETV